VLREPPSKDALRAAEDAAGEVADFEAKRLREGREERSAREGAGDEG
jgi:hypothetical protein